MGIRNYLIDGMSGTGKTAVAEALEKHGYHVIHGDRELKFRGDPETNQPIEEPKHSDFAAQTLWRQKHHCWDLDKVKSIIADHSHKVSFFCGGSRNSHHFIDLMDDVFILDIQNVEVILKRMKDRVALDPTDFGGKPEEQKMVAKLHVTREGVPKQGTIIDTSQPLDDVVTQILENID